MSFKYYLFIPVILLTVFFASGQDQEPVAGGGSSLPAKNAKGIETVKPANNEVKQESGLQATRYMPLGKPNLRVKIPQFKDGVLECLMQAGEMTRVSDDDITIKQMDIEFVGEDDAEMKIELEDPIICHNACSAVIALANVIEIIQATSRMHIELN